MTLKTESIQSLTSQQQSAFEGRLTAWLQKFQLTLSFAWAKTRAFVTYSALPLVSLIWLLPSSALASSSAEVSKFLQTYLPDSHQKKFVWLTGEKKTVSKEILHHPYYKIRAPYWQAKPNGKSRSAKTLWVLEEIGKEKYITIGIVIENQQIQALRILKFRESRGWEVELPSFTAQFDDIKLIDDLKLSKDIQGISGATLSVRAVKKISRLALYLQSTLPNP